MRKFQVKDPNGPPGKAQVNFAKQFGITVPDDITRDGLDKLIEAVLASDLDPKKD